MSISGWRYTQLVSTDGGNNGGNNGGDNGGNNGGDNGGNNGGDNGGNNGGDNGGNNGGDNGGNNGDDNISLEDRPLPDIPEGDYSENIIITEAEQNEVVFDGYPEWGSMPASMSEAIRELVAELPLEFARCTRCVSYVPSKDSGVAMSAEGYIFVTQNSWFAPSLVELTDETRKKRFKEYLLREMVASFLYYRGSVILEWKQQFDEGMSNSDAVKGIQNAAVLFYKSKDTPRNYLRTVDRYKYDFIRNNVIKKYFD